MKSPIRNKTSKENLKSSQSLNNTKSNDDQILEILEKLKKVYQKKILPVEQEYEFEHFNTSSLTPADISSKPMILLLGQYSVGKTTFIKHLLGKEYQGCNIGPEPTTDKFFAIEGVALNSEPKIIPGNAAGVDTSLPYSSLEFGQNFLNRFQVSQISSSILDSITLIDTPGILSGEKQTRNYDFNGVIEWFAERADMILIIFDAHKLDISDEFKAVINNIKKNDEKIKVVLNKADQVNSQQLMRVYGALMWSLGKVLATPEVPRVYIGSFWDEPLRFNDFETLLVAEQRDLLKDIRQLPRMGMIRKINDIIKRARLAKVHAIIISHLKSNMPGFFGKKDKQQELLLNLEQEFHKIEQIFHISRGDFPDVTKFKERLTYFKIDKFNKLDKNLLAKIDEALNETLPQLLKLFPQNATSNEGINLNLESNPFEETNVAPPPDKMWSYEMIDRQSYVKKFKALNPVDGKVSGAAAKPVLEEFGLEKSELVKIWKLADIDKDGFLDADEFVTSMWLCEVRKRGWINEIPENLPPTMIPNYKK
ncbi:Dynamin [Lobulomyces angularis]|nr:Dynamin [Lobulomyces angularis]